MFIKNDFIKVISPIILVFILLPIQVNAYKGEKHHGKEKQAAAKPSGSTYKLAVINPAPDFTLVNLEGKETSLKDLDGKVKIINFIYTSCPDTCPIVTGRLSRLQGVLREGGLLGEKVEIISISLDPERDTAERLKMYAAGFKADGKSWLFLRGTKEQTKKSLSDYDIWSKRLDNGIIDHVMRVYLVDGENMIREIYNLAFLQPELVLRDIEMILIEK